MPVQSGCQAWYTCEFHRTNLGLWLEALNNLSKGSIDEEEEWNRGIPPAEVARAVIGSLEKDEYEIVVGEAKGLVRGAKTNPEQVFKSLNEW